MPACNNCNAMLTQRYTRVFGDNQQEVYGCLHCQPQFDRRDSATHDHDAQRRSLGRSADR
ncbi:DUF7563 family protein [Natrialbaceae archaeon A-gly3]